MTTRQRTQAGRTLWLVLPLLLHINPGSAPITGPEAVSGLEQGSLTVQCRYDPGWETHMKWWCRGAGWSRCKILVQTTGSEEEVKKDRVSIRDNQRSHVFTVTMEKLRRDDTDTYWCGIERTGPDLGVKIKVSVESGSWPAESTSCSWISWSSPVPEHAQCCPLGEQASEKCRGEAESA